MYTYIGIQLLNLIFGNKVANAEVMKEKYILFYKLSTKIEIEYYDIIHRLNSVKNLKITNLHVYTVVLYYY